MRSVDELDSMSVFIKLIHADPSLLPLADDFVSHAQLLNDLTNRVQNERHICFKCGGKFLGSVAIIDNATGKFHYLDLCRECYHIWQDTLILGFE